MAASRAPEDHDRKAEAAPPHDGASARKRSTTAAIIVSVLFHVALFTALIASIDFRSKPIALPAQPIVEATVIDTTAIEAEKKRQRDEDAARKREQERQAREAERKRADEEQKQADAKAEQERSEQQKIEEQRKVEEQRIATAKQQAEERRKVEDQRVAEEKKKADEKKKAEEKRLADEKKKADEKRIAEEKKKAEEVRQAEEARRAVEQAAQDQRDQSEIGQYAARIRDKVEAVFQLSGQPAGLSCTIRLKLMPGGDVVEVVIHRSSGNAVFDRQAHLAVLKAVPLPVPTDPRVFRKMQEIEFEFEPN